MTSSAKGYYLSQLSKGALRVLSSFLLQLLVTHRFTLKIQNAPAWCLQPHPPVPEEMCGALIPLPQNSSATACENINVLATHTAIGMTGFSFNIRGPCQEKRPSSSSPLTFFILLARLDRTLVVAGRFGRYSRSYHWCLLHEEQHEMVLALSGPYGSISHPIL